MCEETYHYHTGLRHYDPNIFRIRTWIHQEKNDCHKMRFIKVLKMLILDIRLDAMFALPQTLHITVNGPSPPVKYGWPCQSPHN